MSSDFEFLFQFPAFYVLGEQIAGINTVAERVDDGQAVGCVGRGIGIDDDVIGGVIVDAEAHRLPVVAVINEVIRV